MSHNPTAKLTKPPLARNLDYCEKGLEALPKTEYHYDKWGPGWIPAEVKMIVTSVAGLKYKPEDFLIYNVHYKDCPDAWVFGYHKNSGVTIDTIATQFGKLPVQMRQWVRHVITVPADNGWAFEWNGSITFIKPSDHMMNVIVHETGHSLDLNGAYADHPLSSSANWWKNYDQDKNVPDPYATTNAVEDVAQNTVVAVYDVNVPGGFGKIEPGWRAISHQYATLIAEARNAGKGGSIYRPGGDVVVTHRLPNSAPVPMTAVVSHAENAARHGPAPDVGIRGNVRLVDTSHRKDNLHSGCALEIKHRDASEL